MVKSTKWINIFKSKFKKTVSDCKIDNQILVVTITTNTSKTNDPYFPKLRYFEGGIIFGVVIYSQIDALEICKIIDGKAKFIFVDSEKKIPIRVNNFYNKNTKKLSLFDIDLGNLVSICAKTLKKTKLIEFKPNDLTVESAWLSLSNYFKILSGKTISVIGVGNIGSKISLKLVETGVDVRLNRKNYNFGVNISNAINIIKPTSTVASATYIFDPVKACLHCDAIIGSSNTNNVINLNMVKVMKPKGIILDIGKGNISSEAIKFAIDNNIRVLRLDVNNSIINFINEYINYSKVTNLMGKKKIQKNISIVSGGFMGENGDVVVDNFKTPTQILGIANGKGNFKKNLTKKDKKNLILLRKKFNV